MKRPQPMSARSKPFNDPNRPHWEHGYRVHGLWLGPDRIGYVGLKPHGSHDGFYHWDAAGQSGDIKGLVQAKKQVMAVLGIEGTPKNPAPLGKSWLEKMLIADGYHTPEHARLLAEKMIGWPNPNNLGKPLTARKAYWLIQEHEFLNKRAEIGWLKPDGTLLGCNHASHDKLIEILGLVVGDVEEAGWIRIGERLIQHTWRATPQQLKYLSARKLPFDRAADRLKQPLPGS